MSLNQLRAMLYKLASILGDLNAFAQGPKAVIKRAGRKAAYRQTGKTINKLFR